MRYFSYINKHYGFGEVTEEQYIQLHGTEETRPYIGKLYRGEITVEEVPEDFREEVIASVEKRNTDWGLYDSREISAAEVLAGLSEVLTYDSK